MIVMVILCFIVRFICPVQLLCLNGSSITEDNHYLQNNLLGIIRETVSSQRDCAVECYAHFGCSSFGFEPKLRTCHLHKKDYSAAPTDLVTKPPWQHSDISQWPKELMGPCKGHVCRSGTRCSVHRVTKAPLCLEAHIYQRDVCTDEPIPKTVCSSESKQAGSVRSCICHTNYRDAPLDVVSVNNTCMVNGSWTQPTINCTGPYVRLTTPSISTYTLQQIPTGTLQTVTGGTSTLVFLVKTCKDAIFALHTNPNTYTPVIEVAIGGFNNQKSFIHECLGCSFTEFHDETSILSCNEYRPFWLSWKNGVIAVGKGLTAVEQQFMQWTPASQIMINYVSISTYVDNPGTWLFLHQ